MHTPEEIDFIKKFIDENKDAKIYLGVDSQRMKKKRVKFLLLVLRRFSLEMKL